VIYLLDTNAFSDLMSADVTVRQRAADASSAGDRVVTCSIVRGEILHGVLRLVAGKKKSHLENLTRQLFGLIPVLPIDAVVADHYSATKADCEARGVPLAENDLWIAACARANGATLVSRDTDFTKVAGLLVENWTP
jgi:predicted nucleic acid-binding protein